MCSLAATVAWPVLRASSGARPEEVRYRSLRGQYDVIQNLAMAVGGTRLATGQCTQCDCGQGLKKCLARHPARYSRIRLNILRRPVFLAAWRAGDRKTHPYRDRKMHPVRRWQELQKCLARHPERYPGIRLNILRSDSQNCLNFSIHFQNNKNFFILVFFLQRSFYHSCSDIASQDLYRLLF